MSTAFISHASKDKYFVDLLVEILKYHRVDCWYDTYDIPVGEKYKEKISDGLSKADIMIVAMSDNTQSSDWVKREINQFHTLKPEAKIVPIFLSPVSPDKIYSGLEEYQSIYFHNNLLIGFRNLLKVFDKEFLPHDERRKKSERREDERREDDRRKHDSKQRLRFGLWKDYEKSTGRGRFDLYEGSVLSIAEYTKALMPMPKAGEKENKTELSKYDFVDKLTGQEVKITRELIERYVYAVTEDLSRGGFSVIKNVYITDSLAEKLTNLYDIRTHDKRAKLRRDSNKERRK